MINKAGYMICTLAFVNGKKLDPLFPGDPRIPHSNIRAAVDNMLKEEEFNTKHADQEVNLNTNSIKLDVVKVSNEVNDLLRPVPYDH